MSLKRFALLIPLAVSACMQHAAIETPPAAVSYTSEVTRAAAKSPAETVVRSFRKQSTGQKEEMIGAVCNVTGQGFRTQITTPAIVNLPTFRGAAHPIEIRCRANDMSVTKVVRPINQTLNGGPAVAVPGGLAGVLVAAAVVGIAQGLRNPDKDTYVYPGTVTVDFEM